MNLETPSKMDKAVDLEEVLSQFKVLGRYHLGAVVLVFLGFTSNVMLSVNYIFTVEQVPYRCKDDALGANATCASSVNSSAGAPHCDQWQYGNPDSFVGEFQLACEDWKRTLVGSVHSFGYMIGLLFIGPLSDRLGRKVLVVVTGVAGAIIGVTRSFMTVYWVYVMLEFLEAVVGDIYSPIFMLGAEMVATKPRVTFLLLASFGEPMGYSMLALLAYLFPYWRTLLRVMYAPALLFIFYSCLLDESPRWLLTKGKTDKAKKIIIKAAKRNKIKLDQNALENLSCERDENVNYLNLLLMTFSSATLIKRFLICVVWWITSTFVNYGMMINSVSLQGNKYLNFGLLSLIDVPGIFLIMVILKYLNRKLSLMLSFFLGAVLCLVQPFVPTDLTWLSIVLYMAGKLMSSLYFNITYIFTSELFPTHTRHSMHALCSSLGRIGSIIAPQTPLLTKYWIGLPAMVFGGVSLVAAFLTILVPDTADDSLPDTVHQAESLGAKTAVSDGAVSINASDCLRHNLEEQSSIPGEPVKIKFHSDSKTESARL